MTNISNLPAIGSGQPYVAPLPVRAYAVQAIIPTNYADVAKMAKAVAEAGIAPKFNNEPARVAAIMMSGLEVGLKPLAALRLFYMTPEGQPALLARGMLAVVQSSGLLEHWEDRIAGDGDQRCATVVCKRRGFPALVRSFSAGEARKAELLGKKNWSKFGDRMLWNRAVSYALNDAFADLLGGLYDPSELGGPVIDEGGQVLLPPTDEPIPSQFDLPKVATKPPLLVNLPDGWEPAQFPRTGKGLREALEFLTGAVVDGSPVVISMNNELLDQIAEKVPALAEEVANLRAAAAEALAIGQAAANDEYQQPPDDDFPGDTPAGS